jgi:hypothetical protein
MPTLNFLYKTQYDLAVAKNKISIQIPFLGDVLDKEEEYYRLVNLLTAMPVDLMVQLDDHGIDFTKINEYELFLYLFGTIKSFDTSLVFGELDLSNFQYATKDDSQNLILYDPINDIEINRVVHSEIANVLRKIHHIEKNRRTAGNEDARKYMLERARTKQRRLKNRVEDSHLESLIVAMVNTKEFKYDFDTVRNLTIFQFNDSVRQIINKIDYDNRMIGVYSGTINAKDLSQDDLNWLTYK